LLVSYQMITKQPNKFIKNAIFMSHTSLNDYLTCPRSYYLKNIYRDPKTGNRIQIANPYLSLGSTVHDSIKWFLDMEGQATYKQLEQKFRNLWLKYSGKRGGFASKEDEAVFGKRGLQMLDNFYKNFSNLERKRLDANFPKHILFEDVVLLGNFDFVGEMEDGTLHILDFKTGTHDEKDPIQLYIYAILAESYFGKPVSKISYWYLDRDSAPKEAVLDPLDGKLEWLTQKAKELKGSIEKAVWECIKVGECRDCIAYQAILDGKGAFQFTDERYHKDIYFLEKASN
jgi:hypothetical protein